jgi:hypothetical protein
MGSKFVVDESFADRFARKLVTGDDLLAKVADTQLERVAHDQ